MQPVFNFRHVLRQECAVSANGVATERNLVWLGAMDLDEVESLLHRFGFGNGGGLNLLQEPRNGVHIGDKVVHLGHDFFRLMNDEIRALCHDVEIIVCDESGDFDNDMTGFIKAGHLKIHPDQHGCPLICSNLVLGARITGTKARVAGCVEQFKGEMMAELKTGQTDLIGRIEGNVAILSFNRPEVRNALSEGVYAGFETALPQIAANPNIHVVMVTGEGGAFCAGGDVKQMNASHVGGSSGAGGSSIEERVQGIRHRQNLVSAALRKLPQPVVAALPGAAAGAGLSIALAADLRIAAERAVLVTAFSNIGASGDFGSSWFLPRLVGEAKAKELLFMSPRLSAEEAYEMGLINAVLPDDNFARGALMWCQELAARAPIALRYMKENINRAGDVQLQTALDAEGTAMIRTMSTADHREAAAAFVEKRAPRFTGQ